MSLSVGECKARDIVTVSGWIGSVEVCAQASPPVVHAVCYDDTGEIELVWLGRRSVPGLRVGRRVTVHGRLAQDHKNLRIFDPEFSLCATDE